MNFSAQQERALLAVSQWLKERDTPIFRLFGFAGTGKTTLAKHFAYSLDQNVAFAAFSGKAAKVMRDKGCTNASTIHSLIYAVDQDEETGLVKYKKTNRVMSAIDMVIIDECSMVGEQLGEDLMSFRKPILVLGDPAQLPPVGNEGGFFTDLKGGEPNFMLDEVHRQAAESNILRLATQIRNGKMPSKTFESTDLTITKQITVSRAKAADTLLVGRNATRARYNAKIRQLKGLDPDGPVVGDLIICLKNDKELGIFNGSMWRIHKMRRPKKSGDRRLLNMDIQSTDEPTFFTRVSVFEDFFRDPDAAKKIDWRDLRGTQQFDYGYAITTHKAQGSQWDDVVVFDESSVFGSDRFAWAYTAVTRAAKHLTFAL